jgi:D-alanyl-D-alanine carboxypeptidase (penicillin-binding protein 5/6)
MTLAVVFNELKTGKLTLDTEFPVSNHAWRTGGAPSGTSTMFAAVRSRVRVEDLIIGAAVVSGNDACIVLAEGIAGSEQAFADRMNRRAAELGLTTAQFRNPTGFHHPDQKISVRDLARLSAHVLTEYPDYYKDSGYGYLVSAVQNNQRLIAVVHGAKSEKDRVDDARRLLDWGFRSFGDRLLFTNQTPIAYASVFGGDRRSVALSGKADVHILSLQGTGERFTARVHYEGPLRAPIRKGAEVAKLRVYRGDQLALETPLYAAEDVVAGGVVGRAFDASYEYFGNLIRSGFRKALSRGS